MVAFSQFNPNLGLGFQPPPSTRSTKTAAASVIPAISRRSFNIPASSSLPRFSYGADFLLSKKAFHAPFASNSDRFPGDKSIQGKATDSVGSNESETAPQGPPFLTIVAGAVVFFLVCWVVGSFVIWLVSPIVNLFISK